MGLSHPHQMADRIAAAQDRLMAIELRRSKRPLVLARRNLSRWMAKDGKRPRPVFQEWDRILSSFTAREIADFLESDTTMARRLCQSSPFMGLLVCSKHT